MAPLGPAREGLDRPEDGVGDVLPEDAFSEPAFSPVFSIAFAAVTLAPSSAAASLDSGAASSVFGSSLAGAVPPIERTLALGLGASPPMLRTLVPPSLRTVGFGAGSEDAAGSFGRLAMVGVCRGACVCCCCVADCPWKPCPWY